MRAAGRVVENEAILKDVWSETPGPGLKLDKNRLHVHMGHLRKKLGAHERLIVSVPGIGYRLRTS